MRDSRFHDYPVRLKCGQTEVQMTWGVFFILIGGAGFAITEAVQIIMIIRRCINA